MENTQPSYADKYEEFIDLYNNSKLTTIDIYKKLGWNNAIFKKARDQALKEGRIKPRKGKPKHYTYNKKGKHWTVYKNINRIQMQFSVGSEKEAKELVAYLDEHGWSKKNVEKYRKKQKK